MKKIIVYLISILTFYSCVPLEEITETVYDTVEVPKYVNVYDTVEVYDHTPVYDTFSYFVTEYIYDTINVEVKNEVIIPIYDTVEVTKINTLTKLNVEYYKDTLCAPLNINNGESYNVILFGQEFNVYVDSIITGGIQFFNFDIKNRYSGHDVDRPLIYYVKINKLPLDTTLAGNALVYQYKRYMPFIKKYSYSTLSFSTQYNDLFNQGQFVVEDNSRYNVEVGIGTVDKEAGILNSNVNYIDAIISIFKTVDGKIIWEL